MPADLPQFLQIRAFVRVAERGSVSRAAEALYRAQSVVTRAVRDLEARLAVPLFERHANGMRLTDQGRRLLPRAQRALAELASVPPLLGLPRKGADEPLYLLHTRRLEVFVKLCETHHMQTVARAFGLSQPAVSAAIKVLEGGIGQPLFERTPKGLLPTRAGRELALPIRRALNELRHLDGDLAALRGRLRGRVVVGALPLGRTRILPEAILGLLAEHPEVQVSTNESAFDLLATELRAGDVDFILGALRPDGYASDLQGEALLTEELLILARPAHPWHGRPLSLAEVRGARWVLPRAGAPARGLFDRQFASQGLSVPPPVVETGDLAVIRGLLRGSDMLALVSAHQFDLEIASGELRPLNCALGDTQRRIGLIHRSGGLHSPVAAALLAILRRQVAGR